MASERLSKLQSDILEYCFRGGVTLTNLYPFESKWELKSHSDYTPKLYTEIKWWLIQQYGIDRDKERIQKFNVSFSRSVSNLESKYLIKIEKRKAQSVKEELACIILRNAYYEQYPNCKLLLLNLRNYKTFCRKIKRHDKISYLKKIDKEIAELFTLNQSVKKQFWDLLQNYPDQPEYFNHNLKLIQITLSGIEHIKHESY